MMWLVILAVGSLAPMWRDATHPGEGRNFWEYFRDVGQPEYIDSHILYEDAVEQAQEAYCSCRQISRRGC